MKRLLPMCALMLALLVPAHSLGASDSMSSPAAKRGEFGIYFQYLHKANGVVTKVFNFQFENVLMTCDTGGPFNTKTPGTFGNPNNQSGFGPMKVKDKEFHKRFPTDNAKRGGGSVKITGEWKAHYSKAVGTLRVKGDYPGVPASGCDSGKLLWTTE